MTDLLGAPIGLVLFIGIPIFYVYQLVKAIASKDGTAVAVSLVLTFLAAATAAWAVSQAREESIGTAIGYAALPLDAALVGLLGLSSVRWSRSSSSRRQTLAWGALAMSAALICFNIAGAEQTIRANEEYDEYDEVNFAPT